jgi:hypothetical protein
MRQLPQHFHPRDFGHCQIEQKDVRLKLLSERQGFASVRRFGHDLEIALGDEQAAQTIAENGVVVGDDNPDRMLFYLTQ